MNYDWDLSGLYADEESYRKDVETFKKMIPNLAPTRAGFPTTRA